MAGLKKTKRHKQKVALTPYDIMAWLDMVMGVSAQASAVKQNCSKNTITNRRQRVQEFVGDQLNIDDYRLPLFQLYPLMVRSLIANLHKLDVPTTMGVLKGLGVLIDKSEHDFNLANLSDDDLDAAIHAITKPPSSSED
ncbi:MAG: hypothetical protein P1R58_10920 [bacterium]|nr:hypothetical protein [bacterium]